MIHTPKIFHSTPTKSTPKSLSIKPGQLTPLAMMDPNKYNDIEAIVDSYIKLGQTPKLEKIKIKK